MTNFPKNVTFLSCIFLGSICSVFLSSYHSLYHLVILLLASCFLKLYHLNDSLNKIKLQSFQTAPINPTIQALDSFHSQKSPSVTRTRRSATICHDEPSSAGIYRNSVSLIVNSPVESLTTSTNITRSPGRRPSVVTIKHHHPNSTIGRNYRYGTVDNLVSLNESTIAETDELYV